MFSGLRAKTLFHRFEIFFRARRAPLPGSPGNFTKDQAELLAKSICGQ
jgi:hypothetical protein